VFGKEFVDHFTTTILEAAFTRTCERQSDQRHCTTVCGEQIGRNGGNRVPHPFDDVRRIGGDPFHGSERADLAIVNVGQPHDAINVGRAT
jgi:predicted metal-dependent phosphoesterase TrpH